MRRREFLSVFAIGTLSSPLLAFAQQRMEHPRRIGALLPFPESDKIGQAWLAEFHQALRALGWIEGINVDIEIRFTAGDAERVRRSAAEFVESPPDVVLVGGTAVVGMVQPLLRSIPVVFVQVTDPVGTGLIKSLAQPGGNMTGFTSFEYSFGGKWLELLKELQPGMTRVAVVQHADNANRIGYLRVIEKATSALNVDVVAPDIRQATDIEPAFATFASEPRVGLIVPPDSFTLSHRSVIIALASRYRLPSVYAFPPFVVDGGLMSYGVDNKDMYRRAASYVSRILRGERPGDLPVQASNKFELRLNLKAAKIIGVEMPPTLLARADEVIE